MDIDQGQLSTIIITIVVAVLGVIVTQPATLQAIIGASLFAKFGIFILAAAAAIYNYLNPRAVD